MALLQDMNLFERALNKKGLTNTTPQAPSLNKIHPIFARHETFHPRYGWLKKGFDLATADQEIFIKDDAPVVLGVGKNMVKSIRYWSYAFKVLEEHRQTGSRSRAYKPTPFGKALLSDAGWDPYLEDPASLWLLHWNLLKAPCYGTTWHYVFNIFYQNTFSAEDVLNALREFAEQSCFSNKPSFSSLNKDINCLLRMYVASIHKKILKEDSLDCPFNELGLITYSAEGKHYSFNLGPKSNLPSHIIVAACLDYIAGIGHTAKTISVSRLCYEPGSPGLIFKLTEDSIYSAIETISEQNNDISLSETAGLVQFTFHKNPQVLFWEILNLYYTKGNLL